MESIDNLSLFENNIIESIDNTSLLFNLINNELISNYEIITDEHLLNIINCLRENNIKSLIENYNKSVFINDINKIMEHINIKSNIIGNEHLLNIINNLKNNNNISILNTNTISDVIDIYLLQHDNGNGTLYSPNDHSIQIYINLYNGKMLIEKIIKNILNKYVRHCNKNYNNNDIIQINLYNIENLYYYIIQLIDTYNKPINIICTHFESSYNINDINNIIKPKNNNIEPINDIIYLLTLETCITCKKLYCDHKICNNFYNIDINNCYCQKCGLLYCAHCFCI